MNYPVQNMYMPYASGAPPYAFPNDNDRARGRNDGASGGRGAGDFDDHETQPPR